MTKKLSERKHSALSVEKYLEAADKLSAFTQEQLSSAKSDLITRKEVAETAPYHVQQFRKFGIHWDRPADEDLTELIEAEALIKREIENAADFVSRHQATALNSDKGKNQQKRRGSAYPELDGIATDVLSRVKYKSAWDGWITSAIRDVESEYANRYPHDKFPAVKRPKSQTTIRNKLESLKLAANLRHR